MAETGYNPLFSHFVKPDVSARDRLQGLVAYALYKQAKKEWAASKAEQPTTEQLRAYVDTWTASPSRLDGLKHEAKNILDDFGNGFVDAARSGIREDAIKGKFWKDVRAAFVGAFCYSVFLIAVVFILKLVGIDVLGVAEKIETKPPQAPVVIERPKG